MSVTFVWRTDVHMSSQKPSSRTDPWSDTVLDKLGQVRDIAVDRGAVAILDGGDFFHMKQPHRTSHALIQKIIAHHATYPMPVYCTPGNHDSVYGDYAFLWQQPLGVLFSSDTFKRCYDDYEVVHTGEDGLKVRVVGIPYHGSTYDLSRFTGIARKDEDILICVAHVLASSSGGKMFEGEDIIRYSDLLDTAPDVFCFGHWHKDQGVEVLGDKTFINIGSLTRGSLSQDNVQRRPACAVIKCTSTGVEVETVRINVAPPEKVFDVQARQRQVKRTTEMETFVENIRSSLQAHEEGVNLDQLVKDMDGVADLVKERALGYLEAAGD